MKTKIAISSWGNIGKAIAFVHSQEMNKPDCDIELVGIIRRETEVNTIDGLPVVNDVISLPNKPEIILCVAPSHCVMNDVEKYLRQGLSTVDCYDNHKEILCFRQHFDWIAKENHAVSILGSGLDPGFNSIQRALFGLVVQGSETITTFGPGRSMGHTTVVKSMHKDIKEAVSITLPGEKPGLQRREVYIEINDALKEEPIQNKIRQDILNHDYFKNDNSFVYFVESITEYDSRNHGGIIFRDDSNAKVETTLFGDNSIMTATAMYNTARAVKRFIERSDYGCYTLVEIPPIDFGKGTNIAEKLKKIKY